MKTLIIFTVVVGLTSAQLSLPGLSSVNDALQKLDISNLASVNSLFGIFGEPVLTKAASKFLDAFKNDQLLKGMSESDVITNFISNARNIFNQANTTPWNKGLDMAILGWSQEQFQGILKLQKPAEIEVGSAQPAVTSSRSKRQSLPSSVDWRAKGAVTPVKNQGSCGSCWSFAAAGALEGRSFLKTGKLAVLSEQNLMDCARNVSGKGCCSGCDGGWMTDAYDYVKINDGISSSSSYPYETKQLQCRYKPAGKAASATGYKYVAQDDENELMKAVAAGPVATAVDASQWQYYKSGILKCTNFKGLDHGVLIVGYGSTAPLGDYWIVKNSWGTTWGENGYIRIARSSNYNCGIDSAPNYPLV